MKFYSHKGQINGAKIESKQETIRENPSKKVKENTKEGINKEWRSGCYALLFISFLSPLSLTFSLRGGGVLLAQSLESQNLPTESLQESQNLQTPHKDQAQRSVKLSTSIVSATNDIETFQSGATLNAQILESNPTGNGDITSILRILPNVQYDTQQLKSATPGEIDPAKISISGGLHYQNNFQIDGFNMNNDINPAGSASVYGGSGQGRSQGLNIDTSLLESIVVQDSNISAAFGGFTGGVVEATTRRPTKTLGANISYQVTQGNADPKAFSLTKYHIYEATSQSLQNFLNSSSESNQPQFIKHLFRSSVESKPNDKSGVIASFTSTQSIIPIRQHLVTNHSRPSPLDPSNYSTANQNQKRESYNFFIKGYYDPSESVRLELSYTYAPQSDIRFIVGTQDNYYNFKSGGHNLGLKSIWENALGTLTHTLSYSFLENSTISMGWSDFKDWYISETKNWSNWVGLAREGGYAPYDSSQHTLSDKIIFDFKPLELDNIEHRFQIGLELGYQYVQNSNPRDYYLSPTSASTFMTQSQQSQCLQTDMAWCDTGKVYDVRSNNITDTTNVDSSHKTSAGYYIWNYGQYFRNTLYYKQGKVSLDNYLFSAFLEDSLNFTLGNLGGLHIRAGARLDSDTYMDKLTAAPRFALQYSAPWNGGFLGEYLASSISAGVNRYYGRNIFAYALAEGMTALRYDIRRNTPAKTWQEVLAEGKICTTTGSGTDYNNCYLPTANGTDFTQLKVPYADELMIGFAQRIFDLKLAMKYIYRKGRDEIRQACFNTATGQLTTSCPSTAQPNGTTYRTYTNEGQSTSNIITLTLDNITPLTFANTKHHILLAFDWTNVKRNYTDYSDTLTNQELANQWISWNGMLVRYADKPAENFNRPYTLRLNTTHTFNLWRTKGLFNNFFRYRSPYKAMASIPASYGGLANRAQPDKDSNGNYIDTFKPFDIRGAFTWDMRIGFEIDIFKGNTLYTNIDIYNVLDSENLAIASASYSMMAGLSATPVYEVGRQFWLQVGYKF
ncbi:TonB-dependent receptor [Helicobacter marmotae]|nr:TonB-dependent receptor plug domain-containing protein [Helicobacter marmotae]